MSALTPFALRVGGGVSGARFLRHFSLGFCMGAGLISSRFHGHALLLRGVHTDTTEGMSGENMNGEQGGATERIPKVLEKDLTDEEKEVKRAFVEAVQSECEAASTDHMHTDIPNIPSAMRRNRHNGDEKVIEEFKKVVHEGTKNTIDVPPN
eukprot:comp48572_c0_seq1/m.47618 comp48572_c0_seq1/g.47618  ORF comp48572_c0_seq1/g.47618 comp48572_c0_seq1/m.47618 type:complete len:152 (-) comp48572_c0_seq1:509-964(-)